MHNPLAVLNTALLRTYAEVTPVTRVLAAIVKRWAKARDINNPARHTLSSYGYIVMLLHFMTYHKRTGNGLVSPVAAPEGDPALRQQPGQQAPPLLPNLQWMDPMWPNFPQGTPYRDLPSIPRNIIQHPMEEGKKVNTYFYRPSTPNDKAVLQMLFPGQDLSLAILLASFFRYYAYEFDYKRFVVSLHSTAARGLVEREVKAELDGWRHYSASLTVEDPFETFYDVAHVLRGGYYHRIRREFAVAYTKIADAASGRSTSNWKGKDISNLSGQELIEWVCEPAGNERDHVQLESDPL
jgi:DNA polymerase sigma